MDTFGLDAFLLLASSHFAGVNWAAITTSTEETTASTGRRSNQLSY